MTIVLLLLAAILIAALVAGVLWALKKEPEESKVITPEERYRRSLFHELEEEMGKAVRSFFAVHGVAFVVLVFSVRTESELSVMTNWMGSDIQENERSFLGPYYCFCLPREEVLSELKDRPDVGRIQAFLDADVPKGKFPVVVFADSNFYTDWSRTFGSRSIHSQ